MNNMPMAESGSELCYLNSNSLLQSDCSWGTVIRSRHGNELYASHGRVGGTMATMRER